MTALRGLDKRLAKRARFERLVLDNNFDVSPVYPPLHLKGCTTAPSDVVEGDLYYNSTSNTLELYDGTAYRTIGSVDIAQDFASTLDVTGAATFDSTVLVTGAATLSSTLGVTGATTLSSTVAATGGVMNWRPDVESVTGATRDLEITDSGTILICNRAAGIAFTLPAATASTVGVWYKFIVDTTFTGNGTITAEAGDLLTGTVTMVDTDTTFTHSLASPDGTDDLIITMNGTTTGGLVPSWLEVYCVSATNWVVHGELFHSGNVGAPFS